MQIRAFEIQNFKGLKQVRLENCGPINAIVGKNNSGKSSVLHAVDMAGLALSVNAWDRFQPKLEVKDLFASVGDFALSVEFEDASALRVTATPHFGPTIQPTATESQKFKTVLILPDVGTGILQRRHRTPRNIMDHIENRSYGEVNALEILFSIKFYANRSERGFTPESYTNILDEIKRYFPDIEEVESDRTEHDVATLIYKEYQQRFDILYSGTGLKHFLDVLLKTTISGATVVLLDEPELGLHPDLQRRFVEYLGRLAKEKKIQFFLATHSQVLLSYADAVTYYRITNTKGHRQLSYVGRDAVDTLLSDLGLRPSDVLNQDICVLVEGASDVVFMEHVIRVLYGDEFQSVAVAVVQYGGGAAEGIVSGAIDIGNIVPVQHFTYWLRDRDAPPGAAPSPNSTKFVNVLIQKGAAAHVWEKREIEFYYPETVHLAAQQGDATKEALTSAILHGPQTQKYREEASQHGICVPTGKYLRQLLQAHLTSRTQLAPEVQDIVQKTLMPWRDKILGVA